MSFNRSPALPPASGTVTTVSVTTANGVSGTVATASTTPAVTLTLGDITPSSVTIGGQSVAGVLPTVQYETPATLATITVGSNPYTVLFLKPAGTIAALTINLPATPDDLEQVAIGSSQIITTVTLGGGTIYGPITALGAGGFATYIYSDDATAWFRMG